MKVYSNLDGQRQIQLIRFLLEQLSTADAANTLTASSQFGYDFEKQRIVFYDGINVRTVAVIEDVYDGHGNTTYISELEPIGIPDVGLIQGDSWFNLATSEYRLCVNPDGLTQAARWNDISNINITYTLPLVATETSYSNLSVFVYSDSNTGISNGNGTIWQNQSGSDALTSNTITSEAELVLAGFTKIGGTGTASAQTVELTINSAWSDGVHSSGSWVVTKAESVYTISIPNFTAKSVQLSYATSGDILYTDITLGTNSVTVSFRDAVTDDIKVIIII